MKTRYVDVHAHLNSQKFNENRDEVVEECRENNILIINCGSNLETNERCLELSEKYQNIESCLGLQPLKAAEVSKEKGRETLNYTREHADEIVGIGEVGLDLYRKSRKKLSKEVNYFEKMIEIANESKLPLNVHSRSAERETVNLLTEKTNTPVIMHAYSGPEELVDKCIENNFYFSVAPRFANSDWYDRILSKIPGENLLTETDSPWLAARKSDRNEPTNVISTVRKIGERKDLEEEKVRKITLENARKIFDI